jgi:hypothetical protein
MVKTTKKTINKIKFANAIFPIMKTMDFEFREWDDDEGKETYFFIDGKYYYIKKVKYGSYSLSSKNYIEYRFMRQDLPFYKIYGNYYDNETEKCFIRLCPVKRAISSMNKKDYQIENFYIEYYTRYVIPKNRCLFCDSSHNHKHNTNTIKHKKNYEKFISDISQSSKLNSDCIKNIMSFL